MDIRGLPTPPPPPKKKVKKKPLEKDRDIKGRGGWVKKKKGGGASERG